MSPSPFHRDFFRLGVSSLTAVVSAASLTAVGWFAGTAARQHQAEQARTDAADAVAAARAARATATYEAAVAAAKSASLPRRVILRPRPHRTVVRTQYVQGAQTPVTLGGTTVSPQGPAPAAPAYHPPTQSSPPPPPPPPPPPAPTSGS